MQADLFSNETRPEPLISFRVPGRLPSWNQILGLEHWARYQLKEKLAEDFLRELRAIEGDSSMRITSAKSTISTFADTLECYLKTRQELRKSRSAKKRLERRNQSSFSSKSLPSGKVPF